MQFYCPSCSIVNKHKEVFVEIEINSRKFNLRELLATEVDDINFEDKKEAIKKQVTLSAGISDEEYSKLTLNERLKLMKAISKLNGLDDFMIPAK